MRPSRPAHLLFVRLLALRLLLFRDWQDCAADFCKRRLVDPAGHVLLKAKVARDAHREVPQNDLTHVTGDALQ